MGIEKFLLSSSLLAVIAQRLIRQLCQECKEKDFQREQSLSDFGISEGVVLYKPKGCKYCDSTGYKGRIAIEEIFLINDDVKEYLKTDVNDTELLELAKKNGMITLTEQIKELLLNGDTSLNEAIRVGIK